jgi:NAD(P)H-hydrate epimerase
MSSDPIVPPRFAPRAREFHKGSGGHLLIIGGSLGLSGAPRLAAVAALRCGAGLVSLAVPESLRAECAQEDPGLMVYGLPATAAGALAWPAARWIEAAMQLRDVAVLGPGLSRDRRALAVARRLIASVDRPMVADADALFAVSERLGEHRPRPDRIFTPHPGEAARLLGCETSEVQSDRPEAARELQRRLGGVVVLKGAGTLVTDGTGLVENPTGNPGLAVGGSGDVLSGIIGALLAQGLEPLEAAAAGVWIHGRAADRLATEIVERAMHPAALLDALPATMAECEVRR